jgi:hypothetical protein
MLPCLLRISCLACCLALGACATRVGGPAPVVTTAADAEILKADAQFGDANRKYLLSNNEAERRRLRDTYLFSRLALVDIGFIDYARSLSANRRQLDSATEAATLTASVAATLRDSLQAKSNLAAFIATVTGLKSNVDKNYFENKGTDAIVSTMAARRKEVLARILASAVNDTGSYPLIAAKMDADQYYEAGTMEGAFLLIQQEAARRDASAQKSIDVQQVVRNVPLNLTAAARSTKAGLTRALASDQLTLAMARAALQALAVPAADIPNALPEAVELLQTLVRAASTPEAVNAIANAFSSAAIPPAP